MASFCDRIYPADARLKTSQRWHLTKSPLTKKKSFSSKSILSHSIRNLVKRIFCHYKPSPEVSCLLGQTKKITPRNDQNKIVKGQKVREMWPEDAGQSTSLFFLFLSSICSNLVRLGDWLNLVIFHFCQVDLSTHWF